METNYLSDMPYSGVEASEKSSQRISTTARHETNSVAKYNMLYQGEKPGIIAVLRKEPRRFRTHCPSYHHNCLSVGIVAMDTENSVIFAASNPLAKEAFLWMGKRGVSICFASAQEAGSLLGQLHEGSRLGVCVDLKVRCFCCVDLANGMNEALECHF